MGSLLDAACTWVDHIHLNSSSLSERDGRPVWLKRRRWIARPAMRFASVFFRWAHNPVEAIASTAEWRRWELEWFRALHGPECTAGTDPDGALWIALLPGASLSRDLEAGTLTPDQLRAAAVELKRAHGFACSHHGAAWSHGDSHTGNFIFDAATGRARLVDFEVRHLRGMPESERHADDLLVLLQDVCGRCPADAWLPLAHGFLAAYGRDEIIALLPEKLHVRRGIPRLWWAVRTTWMPCAELERRLAELREAIPRIRRREETGCLRK